MGNKASRRYASTSEITNRIILGLNEAFPAQITVWRNNRFIGEAVGKNGKKRYVSAGRDGQGDITGAVAPFGRRIEIEVKNIGDVVRETQINFANSMVLIGAIYFICDAHDYKDLDSLVAGAAYLLRSQL